MRAEVTVRTERTLSHTHTVWAVGTSIDLQSASQSTDDLDLSLVFIIIQ